MGRHFRRYCFHLADKLKMTVKRLLEEVDSKEISEWMAYDMTNNPEWAANYKRQQELEMSKQMTHEQKLAAFKRLFRGKR